MVFVLRGEVSSVAHELLGEPPASDRSSILRLSPLQSTGIGVSDRRGQSLLGQQVVGEVMGGDRFKSRVAHRRGMLVGVADVTQILYATEWGDTQQWPSCSGSSNRPTSCPVAGSERH